MMDCTPGVVALEPITKRKVSKKKMGEKARKGKGRERFSSSPSYVAPSLL
jgi:hypothetical protein